MLPALALLLAAPELLGHHALGAGCMPVLTAPPLFRVGGEAGPFEMVLTGVDARTQPLVVDARRTGQVLRSRLDTVLPRGIGWVVLRGGQGELARWHVLWDADLEATSAALATAHATPLSVSAWAAAAEAARGVPTAHAEALRGAARALAEGHAYQAAFAHLDAARAADARCPTPRGAVLNDHLDARLRLAVGDFVGAERRLAQASLAAEGHGFDDLQVELALDHAGALRALGQPQAAWLELASLGVFFPQAGPARARWRLHQSEAGLHLAARAKEVRGLLEAVLAEAGAASAPGARATLHLAGLAVAEERWSEARRHLGTLASIPRFHWDFPAGLPLLVEGAVALGEGAGADGLFERAQALAGATGDGELGWRALHGRGRAAWKQGDVARARTHFEGALAELHRHALRGLDHPQPPYLATHFELVGDLLALLMAGGQTAEALEVAEDARSHRLQHLAVRARLEATAPQTADAVGRYLTARAAAWGQVEGADPAVGEAVLALGAAVPGESLAEPAEQARVQAALAPGEVVVFSLHNKDFVLRRAGPVEPLGLLEPTTHVYVVGGNARAIHHRNPELDGRSWSRLPSAGWLAETRPPRLGPPVVVGDAAVARRLEVAAVETVTPEGLRSRLADARLLHFAGRGPLGGESPWAAHLVLAGGRLAAADLLTRPLAVDRVVLAGGEPGVPVLLSVEDPVGLPDLLLHAGARSVVAATEPVDEAEAARFLAVFYEQGGAERPGPALQAARRTVGRHPFQLWGRP